MRAEAVRMGDRLPAPLAVRGSLGRQRPSFRLAASGELKAALARPPLQKRETGDEWSPVCDSRTLYDDSLADGDAAGEPGRQ